MQTRALLDKVFSDPRSAAFLASVSHRSHPIPTFYGVPEVIFTGRANVGKSSLLNAVLGRNNLVGTSKRPGHTQALHFYRVMPAPGKLILVDAPGYGSRGRPEWGKLFDDYVQTRRELRRIYVLISSKHGLNEVDRAMLRLLNERYQALAASGSRIPFTLQAIITKADLAQKTAASLQEEIFATAPTCLPAIITSATGSPKIGIEAARSSILEACGLLR